MLNVEQLKFRRQSLIGNIEKYKIELPGLFLLFLNHIVDDDHYSNRLLLRLS